MPRLLMSGLTDTLVATLVKFQRNFGIDRKCEIWAKSQIASSVQVVIKCGQEPLEILEKYDFLAFFFFATKTVWADTVKPFSRIISLSL